MDILNIAKARYSTKKFDPSKTIPREQLTELETIFQLSPSSVNVQPWHVLVASTPEAKAKVAQATQGDFAFNESKVLDCSDVFVICVKEDINAQYLEKIGNQEETDGRYATPDIRQLITKARAYFVGKNAETKEKQLSWATHQVYLALGNLLLGAKAMCIDSVPIEGFDAGILSEILDLKTKKLRPVVLVALGYRAEDDFNANLPKSRLALAEIFTPIE